MSNKHLQLVDADLTEGFSVDEVAASLHVCAKTIYRTVERGELKCLRIGRVIRITRDQLAEYLKEVSS